MIANHRWSGIVASGWLVVLAAAGACTVTTGARGTLGFGYQEADGLLSTQLTAALAAGEEIDVVVYAAKRPNEPANYTTVLGKRELAASRVERASVRRARSSDPKVLVVSRIDGSTIRLRGVASGTAKLDVETDAGRDQISIRVAGVGHVEINHWAWRDGQQTGPTQTVLLRGGLAHFTLKRKTDKGQTVTGYGATASVTVEPTTAAVENHAEDTSHLRVRPGQLGRLMLVPRRGTGLSMQVVEPADVVQLEIRPLESATDNRPPTISVDSARLYTLTATVADGRRALGLDGLVQLDIDDPSVCQPEPLTRWFGDGLVAVRGLSAGSCRIRARLGQGQTEVTLRVVGDSSTASP